MSAGAGRVGNSGVICKCVLIQASFDVCSLPPIYALVIRDALPRSVFIQLFDGNANARACHVAAFAGWRGSGEMLAVSKNVVVNVAIMKPICSSSDEGVRIHACIVLTKIPHRYLRNRSRYLAH